MSGLSDMREIIQAAIESRLEQIIVEEIEEAKLRVGQRLRAAIAQEASAVASRYSIEVRDNEVVLRVGSEQ